MSDLLNQDTAVEQENTTVASTTTTPVTDTEIDTSVESQSFFSKLKNMRRGYKIAIIVGLIFALIVGLFGLLGYYTYTVAQEMRAEVTVAEGIAKEAYADFKAQNLPPVEEKLNALDAQLIEIESTYQKLSFYQNIPLANRYYSDGQHGLNAAKAGLNAAKKSISTITPYADVLGFSGEGSFTGGTTEDRLKILLETLDKITPELDAIAADLATVESELAEINPEHYPEEIKGQNLKASIIQAQEFSTGAVSAVTEFRPVLEQLPAMAGGRGERKKYLILFQNDNELRPTGGFLTAYAIINVEDGKVTPEKSDDIYELDKKFNERIPIPESLGRYLTTENYWNLRDMNISPDFKTSMETFYSHYVEIPGEPENIDGIIAIDTHFLTNLLTVLGPVEVPGYGTFSAEESPQCDCPEIIYALSEIITRPTPYIREDRKGILGPMMRAILTKAYGAPKQQWPTLFQTGFASLENRHIQLYFLDENLQDAAKTLNAAGYVEQDEQAEDFLAIINANLGGAKSNLFVDYEVEQVVSAPENGAINKKVEITYNNPRRADNCNLEAGLLCLNSTLRDWTRLYLPAGSELISAQGFTEEPTTYQEEINGQTFTVIDGFFILEPESIAKLNLEYTVPYTDTEQYRVKLWKQGGIEAFSTLFDVTGGQEEVLVQKDTIYSTPF